MIVIADGGSTKTAWTCVENDKKKSVITGGINPFFMSTKEISLMLDSEFGESFSNVSAVYFYGAGAIPEKRKIVFDALSPFFGTSEVFVESDLLGAARGLNGRNHGIACIMGTGSNSCYYDGEKIVKNVSPSGYILGDEGSGAVLGKKLLSDLLKNQLPEDIKNDFFETYRTDSLEIMESVYRKPFPGRYMAGFARFMAKHIDNKHIKDMVSKSFDEFFRRNVLQYDNVFDLPLNFTGSIAFYFRESLIESAENCGLTIDKITGNPMAGLIEYHCDKP